MTDVTKWTFEQRLQHIFMLALPQLGPEAREQLAAVITPQSAGMQIELRFKASARSSTETDRRR